MAILWIILTQLVLVELCTGELVNVALKKPASMSSRYKQDHRNFSAANAVDGITIARPPSIIHTDERKPSAWWMVDLQTQVQDSTVKIYFRTDNTRRRNGVKLYTSTTTITYPPTGGTPCHTFTNPVPEIDSVNCTGSWRYLMVHRNTSNEKNLVMLDFGEVEVIVCSTGTYGLNCTKACSSRQCIMPSSSCDRYTGTCPGGCKEGWMEVDCTQECSSGTYGSNCTNSCGSRHCEVSSTTCNRFNGSCSTEGCQAGWKVIDCTIECSSSKYGRNCTNSCSSRHCEVPSTSCNRFNGSCSIEGCQTGWMGTDCMEACESGTYGNECNMSCEGQHCASSSSCNHVTGQCDGGCQPGWVGADCTQKINDSILVPAVAGAVAGVLVIIIIIIGIIVYRRKKQPPSETYEQTDKKFSEARTGGDVYVEIDLVSVEHEEQRQKKSARKSSSKIVADPVEEEQDEEIMDEDEPSPNRDYYNESADVIREVPVADLAATVRKIRQKEGGFEAEYHHLPNGFLASYDDSQKPENAGKNKFRGYYPYDHNRVRLSIIPDIAGSDYINASLMHSYDQKKTYIAAQAPNKKTLKDFWRMIWEQRCDRVIMLTGLVEDRKVKCYQYWPKDDILKTDHFCVEVEVTDIRANYTVRHLKVTSKTSGEQRKVIQYHYTSWPDHGVPDTLALVNFIWMIRGLDIRSNGPLLVHCSAGIGRTGTYIAVDSLLDQARGEGMVNVQGYVAVMRGQRKNMIQTKEQYECVFHCLVEMTTFGNTSMDLENFTNAYSSRGMDSMVDRKTLRELTQALMTEERKDLPGHHRMWVDGNQDFIVRVGPTLRYLQGYLQVSAPTPGAERLLWKLVEENNVHNVIVVSPVQVDVGKKKSTEKYGGITVTTTGKSNLTSDLSLQTLQVRETNAERSRNVKLFKFSNSPTMDSMPSRLLDHTHLQQLSTEMSPVVLIHSEHDRKSTAWFCIMANILSGILEDHRVDVIGHVRTFLKCCPELTITEKEVESLHEFAQKCVQLTESTSTYANL